MTWFTWREQPHVSCTVNVTNSKSLPYGTENWLKCLAEDSSVIEHVCHIKLQVCKVIEKVVPLLLCRRPNSGGTHLTGKVTLILRPSISERSLVLTVCAYEKYPVVFCVKNLMHFLSIWNYVKWTCTVVYVPIECMASTCYFTKYFMHMQKVSTTPLFEGVGTLGMRLQVLCLK